MGDYGFEGAGEFGGSDYSHEIPTYDVQNLFPVEHQKDCPECNGVGTVEDVLDGWGHAGYKDIKCGVCNGQKKMPYKKPMQTAYKTSFTVFPQDCNYNDPPSVFGGKMLAEMDNAAAMCVRRVLYGTECTDAVTVGVNNVGFHRPAYIGEIVHITAELNSLGDRSIAIMVECERESKQGDIKAMAKGMFTFVSRIKGVPSNHGLKI